MTEIVKDPPLPGWGEPIQTWTYSGAVANVDFINLGGYREILILGEGITFASSDGPVVRVSSDNGSSYIATSYEASTASTTYWDLGSAVTTAHGFDIHIYDFNTSRKPIYVAQGVRIGVGSNQRWGTRAAGPYNAVRILGASGTNLSAGSIRVYGRR